MSALPAYQPQTQVVAWLMRHLPHTRYRAALAAYRIVVVPQTPRPITARQAWLDMAAAVGGLPDVVVYMGVYHTWYPMARRCADYGITFVRSVTDERDDWTGAWREGVIVNGRLTWRAWTPMEVE